jgi:hypothetical protein
MSTAVQHRLTGTWPAVDRPYRCIALFYSAWLTSAIICGAQLITPSIGPKPSITRTKGGSQRSTVETCYSDRSTRDSNDVSVAFVYVYAAPAASRSRRRVERYTTTRPSAL